MRLGELLVREGLIGAEQLEEALGAQLIYGGHLGTCLIELGYVDEAALGRVLAEVSGASCATIELLAGATRHAVSTLSESLVRKHNAVPFRVRSQTLDVAMIDPTNLMAVDELSFASGFNLQTWIAPEIRIYQAMERYYDIPRRQRYVALCRQLDRDETPFPNHAFTARVPVPLGEPEIDLAPHASGRAESAAAERAWGASATATLERGEGMAAGATDATDVLEERLCQCESWDELADVVLDRTARGLPRVLLFRVRGGSAFVWKSRGAEGSDIEGMQFPLVSGSVLGLVRGGEHFRGAIPADKGYLDFYGDLKLSVPEEAMILPLYAADRLIGLFYADAGEREEIEGSTEEFRRLARKLSLAMDLVQIKREIRSA